MTPEKEINKLLAKVQARAEGVQVLKEANYKDRQRIWELERQIRQQVERKE